MNNFDHSQTFRYGNQKIQQMVPSVAWRITSQGSTSTSLTDDAWFSPDCVIDWGTYVGIYGSVTTLDNNCGIAYTDDSFTQVLGNSYTAGNCAIGIGQNNSGTYCSIRMGSCGWGNASHGSAVPCSQSNISTHSVKLWYK